MKRMILAIGAALVMATAGNAATLSNGSLTDTVGSSNAPAGWTATNSVDTTSATSQPFSFLVNPGDSPDGGTWAGLASESGYTEAISQMVTDFVVGTSYTLSWYGTNTGCCSNLTPSYAADNSLYFMLDGALSYTSAVLSKDGLWHAMSYTFVATSTSHNLTFGITSGPRAYMGIDGISVAATNVIPLPGSGILLLAGMGGFAALRRRKKAA